MTIKVGINGMGRIGRMVLRSIIENKNKKILVKHINNRTGTDVVSSLLKYDSVHGKFNCKIKNDDLSSLDKEISPMEKIFELQKMYDVKEEEKEIQKELKKMGYMD